MRKNRWMGVILSGLLFSLCTQVQSQITWTAPIQVMSTNTFGNERPRIVLDRSGDPVVVWGKAGSNLVYLARWNGSGFDAPLLINTGFQVFASWWAGPDVAAFGDTLYVVGKEIPEDTKPVRLFRSTNGGMSFDTPVDVDAFINDSISRFPAVTVTDAGQPLVAFMKFDPDFSNPRWVLAASSDGGTTFAPDVPANGGSGGEACDCCPGGLTASGNHVALLYRDNNANMRDIWAGISADGGGSFTSALPMDTTDWMVMACPSSGPDAVIIGDDLHAVYMTGFSGSNRVYYSKSSLNTLVNDTVFPLSGPVAGLTGQNYPRIATDGSAMGIVWVHTIGSQSQLPLLFTNDLSTGVPAQTDTVNMSYTANPDIALRNGIVHIVWQDDNAGVVKYRRGTYTSVLGTNNVISPQSRVAVYPNPVSDWVTVQCAESHEIQVDYTIYTVDGKIMLQGSSWLAENGFRADLTSFPAGMYYLELRWDGTSATVPVMKCKE